MSDVGSGASGLAGDLETSSYQTSGLLDLSRKLAGAILQRAGQDAERLRLQATEKGLKEGQRQALAQQHKKEKELEEQARLKQAQWQAHLQAEYEENWRELEKRVEENLLESLLLLAGQSLGKLLRQNPAVLAEALREAIHFLEGGDTLRIRMHPEDLEKVSGLQDSQINACDLQADRSVEQGGFVALGARGEIDAQWSSRVAHWKEELS